jgi:hypothetical protein
MKMRRTLVFLLFALAAGTAQAQIKCWTEANGKRGCGDTPPPGAKVTMVRGAPSAPAPAPDPAAKGAKDAKDAKKGPLTPAEKEKDYRERQDEAQKVAAKAEKERQDKAAKDEGCARSREYLQTLDSGQRIAKVNSSGERYYLEEAQVAQEKAKAREMIQKTCS